MASRSINDLEPGTRSRAAALVSNCAVRNVEFLIYCTRRTEAEQAELYEIGRSLPGKIVTNAKAGQSWHNYDRAFDGVPLLNGKPIWKYSKDDPQWAIVIEEAEILGLEWAGRWKTFKEFVHFQFTNGMSLAEAKVLATQADA